MGRFHRYRHEAGEDNRFPQSADAPGPARWQCIENLLVLSAPPPPALEWSNSSEGYSAETQNTPEKKIYAQTIRKLEHMTG